MPFRRRGGIHRCELALAAICRSRCNRLQEGKRETRSGLDHLRAQLNRLIATFIISNRDVALFSRSLNQIVRRLGVPTLCCCSLATTQSFNRDAQGAAAQYPTMWLKLTGSPRRRALTCEDGLRVIVPLTRTPRRPAPSDRRSPLAAEVRCGCAQIHGSSHQRTSLGRG